jgi:hypothetical protein
MHPLIILIIIAAVWLTVRHLKSLPPERRRKTGFKAALLAAGAILLLALVTGRLNPLIAVIAAAIPVMQRLMTAKSVFDQVKSAMGVGPGPGAGGDTRFVSMRVDAGTGKLTGIVREGQFAGRSLGDLSVAELMMLLDECRRADAPSAAAVAQYLRQHDPGAGDGRRRRHASAAREGMSEKEAREILGVSGDAGRDEILTAHRRLMQRLHPDRGGSDYLASKINQAKDLLLGTG